MRTFGEGIFYMKHILFLSFLFIIVACKKEYSVENPPAPIPLPDITGIWVGKLYSVNTPDSMDYCWRVNKDSIFVYDHAIAPKLIPSLKGVWSLNGTAFKYTAFTTFGESRFNDSAILSDKFTKMIGTEGLNLSYRGWGTFVMNKK